MGDIYQIAKVPFRLLLYGLVLVYLLADLTLQGPMYQRLERFLPGSRGSQEFGEVQGWAATVNGNPITKAQLNLATGLFLARRGKARDDLTPSNLKIAQLAVLDGMITDELIRLWSQARPIEVPGEFLAERERQFKGRFLPGELVERCREHDLSEAELSRLLRDHARQQYWLESLVREASTVTAEETGEWYASNVDLLKQPELFRARQIFLSTVTKPGAEQAAKAEAIHGELLANPARFEELAAAQSEDERSRRIGGELGWFSRERMPEDFMAGIEGLKPGELSLAFRTSIGWHIVRLEERLPAAELPETAPEAVREEIAAYLESRWRAAALERLIREQLRIPRRARVEIFPPAMRVD